MKTIFFLLIAAVIAAIVALYGLFGESPANRTGTGQPIAPEQQVPAERQEPQTFRGEANLADIQKLAANIECRVSYDSPELLEPVIGTYFVSDERVRGDFEMNVPEMGGEMLSSVIVNGDMFYSWSVIDGESYGLKANTSDGNTVDNDTISEPVPRDARVSYECQEWEAVDGSIFEPPSDVLFQDMSNVLESGMEYGTVYEEGEF